MAKLKYIIVMMFLALSSYADDNAAKNYWEGQQRSQIYSAEDQQAFEDKLKQRLEYNCQQDIKNSYLGLLNAQEQRKQLSVKITLHSILVSEYMVQRDKIEQDLQYYQFRYSSYVGRCQSESLLTTEQLKNILMDVQAVVYPTGQTPGIPDAQQPNLPAESQVPQPNAPAANIQPQ